MQNNKKIVKIKLILFLSLYLSLSLSLWIWQPMGPFLYFIVECQTWTQSSYHLGCSNQVIILPQLAQLNAAFQQLAAGIQSGFRWQLICKKEDKSEDEDEDEEQVEEHEDAAAGVEDCIYSPTKLPMKAMPVPFPL